MPPRGNDSRPPLVRHRDQPVVAVLLAGGLLAWGVFHWGLWSTGGAYLDIDRAVPLDYRFNVDINSADWPELMQLPGIGETLARRIVAKRAEQSRFTRVEDLLAVRGIGPKTLQRIEPFLFVESPFGSEAIVVHRSEENTAPQ